MLILEIIRYANNLQNHGKNCVKSAKNVRYSAENNKKTREITDFAENRGFGPKSRNLLHPWNRDFLEGQIRTLHVVDYNLYKEV